MMTQREGAERISRSFARWPLYCRFVLFGSI